MKKEPKISVIIPFYKTPVLMLIKAVDNILSQTFKDFELLLIDDGNNDEYLLLIEEYLKELSDSRIKLFHQPNSGVSAARNRGVLESNSQYIVFHDADDFVENNFLHSLYKEIDKSDLVICGVAAAAQKFLSVDSHVDIRQFLSTPSCYNYVQYTNFPVNKIFKKNILIENNVFFQENINLGEDALFLSEYLRYCRLIRIIPQKLYHYIDNSFSATKSYDEKYWEYENKVIETQLALFNTYPLSENEHQFLQHWLYIKLRGAFFYYLCFEKDEDKLENYLMSIFNSDYLNKLLPCSHNVFYKKSDRFIILLWKKLGIRGIRYSFYLKLLKDKLLSNM